MRPILYSYRRCPYAMRARMALRLAAIEVEIREISLREKPPHMLQISPKGTVPVLLLADGTVIDESLKIMEWALQTHALGPNIHKGFEPLIAENDSSFKSALDGYKYPERFTLKSQFSHRDDAEVYLQKLENLLIQNRYLCGDELGWADIAIFPFVRQFAAVDQSWFATTNYPRLQEWLAACVASALFDAVMQKQPLWQES